MLGLKLTGKLGKRLASRANATETNMIKLTSVINRNNFRKLFVRIKADKR